MKEKLLDITEWYDCLNEHPEVTFFSPSAVRRELRKAESVGCSRGVHFLLCKALSVGCLPYYPADGIYQRVGAPPHGLTRENKPRCFSPRFFLSIFAMPF